MSVTSLSFVRATSVSIPALCVPCVHESVCVCETQILACLKQLLLSHSRSPPAARCSSLHKCMYFALFLPLGNCFPTLPSGRRLPTLGPGKTSKCV